MKPFLSETDRISSFNLCQLAFQLETYIFEQLPNSQEDLINEDLESIVIDFKNDSLEKEDIVKGIYGFMFENTLKRYQKAQEIDVAPRGQGERPQGVRVQTGMQRFFINLGTMDGANPGEIRHTSETLRPPLRK